MIENSSKAPFNFSTLKCTYLGKVHFNVISAKSEKNEIEKWPLRTSIRFSVMFIDVNYKVFCQTYLNITIYGHDRCIREEALAIMRIFSLVDMITKAKFSNSPNDFKIRLFG